MTLLVCSLTPPTRITVLCEPADVFVGVRLGMFFPYSEIECSVLSFTVRQ